MQVSQRCGSFSWFYTKCPTLLKRPNPLSSASSSLSSGLSPRLPINGRDEQVVVEGATMSWGGLLFRDPMLSWMNVVKYTTRNKFLDFGGLNSKIDDSMARKPIGLLLDYFFVTYTTLTIARDPRR